ncbi:MAG: glycosyltransferase family 2 protein [Tannerellaceae bacterium]|jgi:GT2 family glycosyltransferase|nr:glycosyltransferase family 2 protein [Tannerellaceae bacterium]
MKYQQVKVSVIIVNYNVKYFLEQCLQSVRVAMAGIDAEVFVVDNHSTDGSVAYLSPKFPKTVFIKNTENKGFAAANNQAIRRCRGEYVLLLNPDTVIGEESIRTLCFFMDEHPKAGAVGVKMIDGHGAFLPESKRKFPSPWVAFCRITGLGKLFPQSKLLAGYNLPYLSAEKEHPVDVLSGAFMMIRHEALDKAGLLDESFFMYGEDIDLSYRLALNGYTNYYVPERILHYKGESTQHNEASFAKNFYGAMLIFYRKYYRKARWLVALLIRGAMLVRILVGALERFSQGINKEDKEWKKNRKRRLLVLCRKPHFETIKTACMQQMPGLLEFVYLWDTDEERVMDAINRRNQMKRFTDIAFCFPDLRYEQMLLFMDTLPNKKLMYHLYNSVSDRLVSPSR